MFDLVLRQARIRDDAPLVNIAIRAGMIEAVAPSLSAEGRYELDLAGAVVTPAFVDAHLHVDKARTCGPAGGADGLMEAIARNNAYRAALTEDDVMRRGRGLLAELTRHGVCAVRTHCDIDAGFGLRGVGAMLTLKREFSDRIYLQLVAFPHAYTAPPEEPHGYRLLREALAAGCDVVGGAPHLSRRPRAHVDAVLRLAGEFDCLVDLHVDEFDTPGPENLSYIAEATTREGLQGRVTCSHCCSLALLPDPQADRVVERMARAELHVVACPLTNLFLQGGPGRTPGFRGLTRVKDLMKAGVNVAFGSDNIGDAFNPYGDGDPLLAALVGGLAGRLGTADELLWLLHGVTGASARALGLKNYGLARGCRANLVVVDRRSLVDAATSLPRRRLVLLNGRPAAGEWPEIRDEPQRLSASTA